jgi:hypothetical protein
MSSLADQFVIFYKPQEASRSRRSPTPLSRSRAAMRLGLFGMVVILAVSATSATVTQAQAVNVQLPDQCHDILPVAADELTTNFGSTDAQSWTRWFCSVDVNTLNEMATHQAGSGGGGGIGIDLPIPDLPIGFSGKADWNNSEADARSQYLQQVHNLCASDEGRTYLSTSFSKHMTTANQGVVAAWTKCMSVRGTHVAVVYAPDGQSVSVRADHTPVWRRFRA